MAKQRDKQMLEDYALYGYNNQKPTKKGLDRCFLHYGVRQEDLDIIADACRDAEIDVEWFKEHILKPYTEERNNENLDDRKLRSILNKALKKVQ